MSIIHKIKKAYDIGIHATFIIIKDRCKKKYFHYKWQKKAQNRKANNTWQQTCFSYFFEQLKKRSKCFTPITKSNNLDIERIEKKAKKFLENEFDILGSGEIKFEKINWHSDFKLKKQNKFADHMFDQKTFYNAIKIKPTKNQEIKKDIKVPWELSRFYHLPVMAKAYELSEDEQYAKYFVEQVSDWIENNPFLLGIHWLYPMEAAIRSVNWIHAFCYFNKSKQVDHKFWKKFISSLYNHFIFIENNWEISDLRTSNHYLSDLLGYFYLSVFFDKKKQIRWCYKEMLKECEKQIFNEGTSYEGSTAYHRLVTEIFLHFQLLCKSLSIELPERFNQKLDKMISFIDWVTPNDGKMITIGDDDSGRIIHPLFFSRNLRKSKRPKIDVNHFDSFGISIIKTKKFHITMRHHAYHKKQPTGHFHNDFASITLNINGTPILVDPGSYVYTASEAWRNHFRSAQSHNTFFLQDHEPIMLGNKLFELNIPDKSQKSESIKNNVYTLKTTHNLYSKFYLKTKRAIFLDKTKNILTIEDEWVSEKNNNGSNIISCWNFVLGPNINPIKNNKTIEIPLKNKKIFIQSNYLSFDILETWIAPTYGKKIKTNKLTAKHNIVTNKKIVTKFFVK